MLESKDSLTVTRCQPILFLFTQKHGDTYRGCYGFNLIAQPKHFRPRSLVGEDALDFLLKHLKLGGEGGDFRVGRVAFGRDRV